MHSLHRDDLALRSDDTPGRAMASGVGAPQSQPPRRVQRSRERAGIDGGAARSIARGSVASRSWNARPLRRNSYVLRPSSSKVACAWSMAWFPVRTGRRRSLLRPRSSERTPRGDSRPYGRYLSKIRVSIVWNNKRPCGGSFGCKLGAALEVPPQCRYNANEAWFGA